MIKTLNQAIAASLNDSTLGYKEASLTIDVCHELWTCYAIEVSYRDLLLYCDKGTATMLVDTYGSRHTAELFDWECDQDYTLAK